MKKRIGSFIIFFILLSVGLLIYQATKRDKELNIILISIDALRADHLGCCGYSRNTSPNIDFIAKKSILFKNAITLCPRTTPSMVSALTSLYPHTHGIRDLYEPLDSKFLCLQEILQATGYKTAAFVSNWVLKKKFSNLNQGFKTYDDIMPDKELNRNIYERKAADTNKAVINWLNENYKNKFFLWIHYQDVHGPYIAPQRYQDLFVHTKEDLIQSSKIPRYQHLDWIDSIRDDGYVDANLYRDAYDAEIRFCDEYIGNLFKKLRDLGLTDIIIIITADHGESLGEHNYYFEHGKYVYDQCSRIPLLIYVPYMKGQKVVEKQVNIMDITPTVLDMLGYPIPQEMEGVSLLPLIENGESAFPEISVFIERLNILKAVRTNSWKYIKNLKSNTEELYDLKNDPEETNNIISKNRNKANELKKILHDWMNENDYGDTKGLKDMNLKKTNVEALKSLGYLQ